jgi:TRAP-type C4-dicarboxylate transport system substrate-binding protein
MRHNFPGYLYQRMTMRFTMIFKWQLVIFLALVTAAQAGGTVIKIAVVTPEGSSWVKVLKEMVAEVRERTEGEVDFQIFAGGISGDEADVLRKMRANRLQAAGLSGVGAGIVLPEIRVLEAPLLFHNDAEIDRVRDSMFDYFAGAFDQKGYVLLGFVEGGWVYLFGQKDLSRDDGLQNAKMWVWQGDRVAETFLNAFGVRTTPLNIADVNTGLETGMIDAFYAPPLAALTFQWAARVGYMLDYPLANSTGALLMTKTTFARLPATHQQTLKDLARQYCGRLTMLTRKDNSDAKTILGEQQLQFVKPSGQQMAAFQSNAQTTYNRSIPELYPQALFDQIQTVLGGDRQ